MPQNFNCHAFMISNAGFLVNKSFELNVKLHHQFITYSKEKLFVLIFPRKG